VIRRWLTLALLLTMLAWPVAAESQTLAGTIGGRVADELGGVLPGVTITLTSRTGALLQVTDTKGEFRFLGLDPGTYSVKAELQGFRSKGQEHIDLSIGRTVDVRLTLAVGGITESVEVTANAVTVDTATTATETGLTQGLLFSMPIVSGVGNVAINIVNYTPGVTDGAAFGGGADGANSLMLDGVDTRDPESGTAWTFFNYHIIDEVQVGAIGQPAEYGGFTGAVVNTITKSGGNVYSGLFDYRYTGRSLAGNNAEGTNAAELNPSLASPSLIDRMHDYTVQLGGPVKKDKAFFFVSVQRYSIEQDPDGPRTIRSEASPRFNVKVNLQPTSSDTIVAALQYDNYNQRGRPSLGGENGTTDDRSLDQDSPEAIWSAQYRKVFGPSTLLEARWAGYWGYYDLNPVNTTPAVRDWDTNEYSGGGGEFAQYDRTRNQVNVALTKYAQGAGSHALKLGVEIERSHIRNRYSYSIYERKPIRLYVYGQTPPDPETGDGSPYWLSESSDVEGVNGRESYYAQDQWKLGRVTANVGVRVDDIRGFSPALDDTVYRTRSVAPRLGAAIDLTGRGTSALRAFYGQLYDGAVFQSWSRALPGIEDNVYYRAEKIPGKSCTEANAATCYAVGAEFYRISNASAYTVSDAVKHPRTDEFNIAFEQQLFHDYRFTATFIARNAKNFVDSTLVGALWTPVLYDVTQDGEWPEPPGPGEITLYRWANPTSEPKYVIQNVDNVSFFAPAGGAVGQTNAYRHYRGLMLIVGRALKDRWQAQYSYVYSRTMGDVNNDGYEGAGSSTTFENPNYALVNSDGVLGYDRTHEFKLFVGYQVPKVEVGLDAYLHAWSGHAWQGYTIVTTSDLDLGLPDSIEPRIEPRGSRRAAFETILDLRAEKVVPLGLYRLGLYLDIQNLFNAGTVTASQSLYPSDTVGGSTVAFGSPSALVPARQLTVGARFSF
jgi:hypothetical protein